MLHSAAQYERIRVLLALPPLSDGPRRREALPVSGVLLHVQDQAAAQRAPQEALGKALFCTCSQRAD